MFPPRFRTGTLTIGMCTIFAGVQVDALAVDKPLTIGIQGAMEFVTDAEYRNQPDSPAVDLAVRWAFSPGLSVEASVGYRSSSLDQVKGVQLSTFSLTQAPILAGAAWTFWPSAPLPMRLGAGIAILPTRTTYSLTGPGSGGATIEMSTTVIGGYAGIATQIAMLENLFIDVGVRFVLNPVPTETGRPTTQNYFSTLLGFSSRF